MDAQHRSTQDPRPPDRRPRSAGATAMSIVGSKARILDDNIVKVVALVLVAAIVAYATFRATAAAEAIEVFRTWVTQYFTWYFVVLASAALAFCLVMAFSRRGRVVLGGPDARPEYGTFAWTSMLFACGQGIGLIFWSVAEPILVRDDNPLLGHGQAGAAEDAALVWTYFHWSVHAWAIYCVVALCLALNFHNRNRPMTFRDSVVNIFPEASRRPLGVLVEIIAILATIFGLSTSFAFAAMQFTSGLSETFGVANSPTVRIGVIVVFGVVAALSVYVGIEKGMKRISEVNSILSIVLVLGVVVFGPTLYILSILPQSAGQYATSMWWMGLWTDAPVSASNLGSWMDSWNGNWTVFIWCWCWAFSPFVGSFIARISRGRTVRQFVLGVLAVPSLICVVWIGVIGAAALRYDADSGGSVTAAVGQDVSLGLFAALGEIPIGPVMFVALLVATILVATYFITSLDSGVHALAGFAASATVPSRLFRAGLVVAMAGVAIVLLTLGGETAVGTVQTGTIIGALPYTVVVLLMATQAYRIAGDDAVDPDRPHPSIASVGSDGEPAEAPATEGEPTA